MADPPKKKMGMLPAAAEDGDLPENLLFEILSWLPIQSLARFRCVSKLWRRSIGHPYLRKLRSLRRPFLLLSEPSSLDPAAAEATLGLCLFGAARRPLAADSFALRVKLAGRGDGGTSLLPSTRDLFCVLFRRTVFLVDPTFRDSIEVCTWRPIWAAGRTVVSDVGFGYLPAKKEYKLLLLGISCRLYTIRCYKTEWSPSSCSSYSMTWRHIAGYSRHKPQDDERPVFVKGSLYWKIARSRVDRDRDRGAGPLIFAFDFEGDKFRVPEPQPPGKMGRFRLLELRGELWIGECEEHSRVLNMWAFVERERPREEWRKLYSIDFGGVCHSPPVPLDAGDEEILMQDVAGGRLHCYNVKSKCFNKAWFDLGSRGAVRLCPYSEDSILSRIGGGLERGQ